MKGNEAIPFAFMFLESPSNANREVLPSAEYDSELGCLIVQLEGRRIPLAQVTQSVGRTVTVTEMPENPDSDDEDIYRIYSLLMTATSTKASENPDHDDE